MKSFGKVLFGIVLGVAILAAGIFLYLKFGRPPVAVADPPFPYERPMVKIPLRARIEREMKTPPFEANEEVLEAGARVSKTNAPCVMELLVRILATSITCSRIRHSYGRSMDRMELWG